MVFRRILRRRFAGWLAMAILFAQVATSAYACPANLGPDSVDMPMAGMPCPERMASGVLLDVDQPALCLAHCQFGTHQQPADHAQPQVAAAVTVLLFALETRVVSHAEASPWAQHERNRGRSPPPSHTCLHCVYRI